MNEQQWVTLVTTATMAGSTLSVSTLLAVWRKLTGVETVWIPFILSVVIVGAVMTRDRWPSTFLEWIVIAVNIGMVFLSVIGANEGAVALKAGPKKATGQPNKALPKVWIGSLFGGG
jgi:hypothetical protein